MKKIIQTIKSVITFVLAAAVLIGIILLMQVISLALQKISNIVAIALIVIFIVFILFVFVLWCLTK